MDSQPYVAEAIEAGKIPDLELASEPASYPLKVDIRTRSYLRGNARQQLLTFSASRMRELLKEYASLNPIVVSCAMFCTRKEVKNYVQTHDSATRIMREERLGIIGKALLSCMEKLPQYDSIWKDSLRRLLSNPRVAFYDS